jgi:hypothetical protein
MRFYGVIVGTSVCNLKLFSEVYTFSQWEKMGNALVCFAIFSIIARFIVVSAYEMKEKELIMRLKDDCSIIYK